MSSHTDRSKLHLFQLNADLHGAKLQQLTWEIAAEELELDVAEVDFDDDPREQERDELKAKLVSVASEIADMEAQIRQLSLAEQSSQAENLTAEIAVARENDQIVMQNTTPLTTSSDLSPNTSPRHQPAVTATSPPPVTQSPQPKHSFLTANQPIATAASPPQPSPRLSHPNATLYSTAQSLTHYQSVDNGSSKSSKSNRDFIARIAKPQKFRSGDEIILFLDRFEEYIHLSQMEQQDLDLFLLTLIEDSTMYRKLKGVFSLLQPRDKSDIRLMIAALKSAIQPAAETRIKKINLLTIRQKEGETIEDFTAKIRERAELAYSEPFKRDEAAINALTAGVLCSKIHEKLVDAEFNSFEEAYRLALKYEEITNSSRNRWTNQDETSEAPDLNLDVLAVVESNQSVPVVNPPVQQVTPRTPSFNMAHRRPVPDSRVCYKCNRVGHIQRYCNTRGPINPASSQQRSRVICYTCNQNGHYSSECQMRQRNVSTQRTAPRPDMNQQQRNNLPQFYPRATQNNGQQAFLNEIAAGNTPIASSQSQ